MPALITPTQLKEHVETDLADSALQRIIDSEDAEIVRRCGALATTTVQLASGNRQIVLPNEAASITSVTEYYSFGGDPVTLTADDWWLVNPQVLQRGLAGENAALLFAPFVTVVYVPANTTAQRTLALIDLCKLAIQFNALGSERVGDYSSASMDYNQTRNAILRRIMPRTGWFAR